MYIMALKNKILDYVRRLGGNNLHRQIRSRYRRILGAPDKTRIAYIDVCRGSLLHVLRQAGKMNTQPVVYLGYGDCAAFAKARKQLSKSDCLLLDYWTLNAAGSLLNAAPVRAFPNGKVLKSPAYVELRDKTLKMMDRQDINGLFRRQEREVFFWSLFLYFWDLFDRYPVDVVVSAHSPHLPATMVFYGVCELRGARCFHVREMAQAPVSYIQEGFDGLVLSSVMNEEHVKNAGHMLTKYFSDHKNNHAGSAVKPEYMIRQELEAKNGIYVAGVLEERMRSLDFGFRRKMLERAMDGDIGGGKPEYMMPGPGMGLEKSDELFWKEGAAQEFQERVRGLQLKHHEDNVHPLDLEEVGEFVYFPLHYEPEKTSNPDGGRFYDSIEALLELRRFVPKGVAILVKEHPSMFFSQMWGYVGRSPWFYDLIARMDGVYLVDSSFSSGRLVRSSSLTASLTGTACLEAAALGRKALIFGSVWFDGLPNIWKWHPLIEYESIVSARSASGEEVQSAAIEWVGRFGVFGGITGSFIRMYQRALPGGYVHDSKAVGCAVCATLRRNGVI
ncbi:hypothetical protein [Thioalkalivibrio sp. ALE31]|uniref:hypothetical protein n=1 Tax=Thioalkalivibrio sp. ALE31 TaxID=1158182 RepID=UPI0018CA37FB|nr:hypothetical protein [Thioalkalivibrio sp. ALE31]